MSPPERRIGGGEMALSGSLKIAVTVRDLGAVTTAAIPSIGPASVNLFGAEVPVAAAGLGLTALWAARLAA